MDPHTDADALAGADPGALHRQVWDAIPWVVNGRASDAQRAQVDGHVASCADCRGELQRQQALQQGMQRESAASSDVEHGLQRLWQRLDQADEPDVEPIDQRPGPRSRWLLGGLAAAVVVQAIGLGVLGVALWSDGEPEAVYRTLAEPTTPIASRAAIRIVARPQMSLGELQRVLSELELEIVAGPNQAGAYALAPRATRSLQGAPAALDEQIARLRAMPGMMLVEPVAVRPVHR